jgi:hypothetical protein
VRDAEFIGCPALSVLPLEQCKQPDQLRKVPLLLFILLINHDRASGKLLTIRSDESRL